MQLVLELCLLMRQHRVVVVQGLLTCSVMVQVHLLTRSLECKRSHKHVVRCLQTHVYAGACNVPSWIVLYGAKARFHHSISMLVVPLEVLINGGGRGTGLLIAHVRLGYVESKYACALSKDCLSR